MKVLFINTVYGKGSTGRIIESLGNALEEKGHEFKVAYGRGETHNDSHCYRIGSKEGTYFHAGISRLTDKSGFYSNGATKKLISFIKEYNPDIIHLHNLHGYYLNVEILFDFLKNEYHGKVFWTLHDCWSFTGHCMHFTFAGCDRWKTGCFDCMQKNEYPKSILSDNSKENYIKKKNIFTGVPNLSVITVSHWLESVVNESYLKDYPVKCIYNGIDTEKFRPVENNIKEELNISGKKMILAVSDGWTKQKGFSTVIDIAKKSPEDWHFVIIGLDKEQLTQLPENITGYERIWNQDKLIEYYSAADVFFNPSIEETFGLVTGEAIACSTPAVVFNKTACPELIVGDENGSVIDYNASSEEIIKTLESNMNKKGKKTVVSTKEQFINEHLCFYGV